MAMVEVAEALLAFFDLAGFVGLGQLKIEDGVESEFVGLDWFSRMRCEFVGWRRAGSGCGTGRGGIGSVGEGWGGVVAKRV